MRSKRLAILLSTAVLVGRALAAGPEEIPAYRQGIDALAGELWSVAADRFEEALATPELEPETKQTLLLRLAESLVRGDQGARALQVLADPLLAGSPDRSFWSGQAQVAAGRFGEAIEELAGIPEKSPFYQEAQLTLALVHRALGDLDHALEAFDRLGRERNAPTRALLLKAETLLEAGHAERALAALPTTDGLPQTAAKRVLLLRGEALLALEKPAEAEAIFAQLASEPEGQNLRDFHQASIDLARARLAQGAVQTAADGLLAFIQQNPESPLLDEAFSTLLRCLPAQPTPNDPILARLREWAPDPLPRSPALLPSDSGSTGSWPTLPGSKSESLGAEALYHLALATRRLAAPDAALQARRLLVRLRKEFPGHPLVARSLLELGRWDLDAGRKEQAAAHFTLLEKLGSNSPNELRAEGLALEARSRFSDGDFATAARLFDQASALLEDERRLAARQNAAVSLLAAGELKTFDELAEKTAEPDLAAHLTLERGIYLASKRDPAALPTLLSFIGNHPDHPRLAEARLHAALAAVNTVPALTEEAASQLAAIPEEQRSKLRASTLAVVEIRLHEARGAWAAAAARAQEFLDQYPADPARPMILYERGRALYQNKDFNEAGIVLRTLATEFPDHPDTPAALLLSARAAAEGATPQSRKESIELFQQLAAKDSPFQDFARLELADLYILRSQLDEAIALLEPWFQQLEKADPLLVDVGLKLGEALYARAQENPAYLERALKVQDRLLSLLPEKSTSRQAILYQKGLTLEQFGDRDDDALSAYMEVVQEAAEMPEGDWNAIERCGFSALRILEKREQWSAAKKLAERIRDLNGPRSAEAAERAKNLGLEHMIWDEE